MTTSGALRSRWFWFSLVWAVIIFIASVIPSVDLPSVSIWEADKLVHAIIYGILTFFVARAIYSRTGQRKESIIRSAIICIAYSIAIELVQRFLPTRSFDVLDILANCIGTALGVLLLWLTGRRK